MITICYIKESSTWNLYNFWHDDILKAKLVMDFFFLIPQTPWEFYHVSALAEYVIPIVPIRGHLCKVIHIWDEIDYSLLTLGLGSGKARIVQIFFF